MKRNYKKNNPIRLTAKAPKSRDLVHLGEITHGSGAGYHKSKKDYNRKNNRKVEQEEE
jgi:hypothetical protein